ncbi:hypothetical protein LCGC14_2995590, partial [marine sediment metagenome]
SKPSKITDLNPTQEMNLYNPIEFKQGFMAINTNNYQYNFQPIKAQQW